MDDLNQALGTQAEALSLTGRDSAIHAAYLDDWATAMLRRYRFTYKREDLASATEAREALVRLLPAGTPELVMCICLLVDDDRTAGPDISPRTRG